MQSLFSLVQLSFKKVCGPNLTQKQTQFVLTSIEGTPPPHCPVVVPVCYASPRDRARTESEVEAGPEPEGLPLLGEDRVVAPAYPEGQVRVGVEGGAGEEREEEREAVGGTGRPCWRAAAAVTVQDFAREYAGLLRLHFSV